MRLLTSSCLSVTLSVRPSICPHGTISLKLDCRRLCLSVCLSICPSAYLSAWNNSAQTGLSETLPLLSVCLSASLSVRMEQFRSNWTVGDSAYLSVCPPVSLSVRMEQLCSNWTVGDSAFLSVCLSVRPSAYLSAWNNSAQTGLSETLPICLSVCPSVYLSAWNNSAQTWRNLMRFHTSIFSENLSTKFTFHYSLTIITTILNEHVCIRMTMSRWIFLRTSNVSKLYRKLKHTFYVQ
jgi:hypothetical protein